METILHQIYELVFKQIFSVPFYLTASGFYKRHKRTKDWSADETIKFYRSLQAVGTDFSVMLQLFPNRSRRDLKLKVINLNDAFTTWISKLMIYSFDFLVQERRTS